jgi:hypothetical protein
VTRWFDSRPEAGPDYGWSPSVARECVRSAIARTGGARTERNAIARGMLASAGVPALESLEAFCEWAELAGFSVLRDSRGLRAVAPPVGRVVP